MEEEIKPTVSGRASSRSVDCSSHSWLDLNLGIVVALMGWRAGVRLLVGSGQIALCLRWICYGSLCRMKICS